MIKKRMVTFAVIVGLMVANSLAPKAEAALVGSYSFEEKQGTRITDASGRNNHGTLVNPLSDTWTTGHSGGGIYLPGIAGPTATYVDLGNPPDFQMTKSFSFAAWVYSTAPDTDAPILAKEDNNYGTSYWFGVFYNGFGTLLDVDGWWDWDLDRRNLPVTAWNQWKHLAATWDGTTLKQYLNGVLVDTVPFSGPIANTASNLTIGINSGVWSTAFTGRLDDIKIYDHALSAAEVSQLAEAMISGCVNLKGVPLANAKVTLKQSRPVTTATDSAGCYKFKTVTPGQKFTIEIAGTVAP